MNVGVIGTGNMGKNHLRAYHLIPHAKLTALADISPKNGLLYAKKYKIPFYENFLEMIQKEHIEAVSVCVPTKHHFQVASLCIQKKIHVLLEKPIALDVKEAKKLKTLAQRKQVKLIIGHIERYNPAVKKIKEIIDKGDLGNIISVITRRIGGFPSQVHDVDIAVDLAIHDIDIVNYLFGKKPDKIIVNKQNNHIQKRADSVEFFLKYGTASVYIQANWISPVKIRKITITGTEGYLEMDYITQKIDYYKSNYNKFKQNFQDYSDYVLLFSQPDKILVSVEKKEPLKEELLYFLDSIKNNYPTDPTHAIDALEVAQYKV